MPLFPTFGELHFLILRFYDFALSILKIYDFSKVIASMPLVHMDGINVPPDVHSHPVAHPQTPVSCSILIYDRDAQPVHRAGGIATTRAKL